MENEMQIQWPAWPALEIQQWLKINSLNAPIYYKFGKIGKFHYVVIVTKKPKKAGEEHPWPVYPAEKIQTYLNLDLDTIVSYQHNENNYAVVWVEDQNVDQIDLEHWFMKCE